MASKIASQGYSTYEASSSGFYASSEVSRTMNRSSSACIDVSSLLHQLNDPSSNQRVAALDQLFDFVRHSTNGDLQAHDHLSFFQSLALALQDPDWEIRNRALNVISELLTRDGINIDSCMMVVLPHLIPCLGDTKVTVRRSAIQCIRTYMKHTSDFSSVIDAIIQFGLEAEEMGIQRDTCVSVPLLFTQDFAQHDYFGLVQMLTKKLLAREDIVINAGLKALEYVRGLIGESQFNDNIKRLSPALQRYYFRVTKRDEQSNDSTAKTPIKLSPDSFPNAVSAISSENRSPEVSRKLPLNNCNDKKTLAFGMVPIYIMEQLEDTEDFRMRAQAVDELKTVVIDIDDVNAIIPHLGQFLAFLLCLLDDANFKITTVTLEILILLVDRLGVIIQPHLKQIIVALSKRLGDNKIVVRQAVMRLAILLMQNLKPHSVLSLVCENLRNRNSRVRQETLNIIICALLTFPSTDFDQSLICRWVAPCLTDAKRVVRHAALECMAVLAQSLGAGNLQPIVDAVEESAGHQDGSDLLKAVQARLARRQLPRYTVDGLIEYSSPVPTSATHRRGAAPVGADSQLVLAASSSAGSARARPAELVDLESQPSGATEPQPHTLERRRVSAGKVCKTKLPWEQEEAASAYSTPARSRAESPTQNGSHSQYPNKAFDVPPLTQRVSNQDEYGHVLSARKTDPKRLRESCSSARGNKNGSQSLPASGRVSPQMLPDSEPNTQRQTHRIPPTVRTQRKLEPLNSINASNGVSPVAVTSALNNSHLPPQERQQEQEQQDQLPENPESTSQVSEPVCPIPTRPTLVRSAGKRRGVAPLVPPIPLTHGSMIDREEPDSGIQSATASASDSRRGVLPFSSRGDVSTANTTPHDSDNEEGEMYGSLTTIRSSASRKKAMRVFEKAERRLSPESTGSLPATIRPSKSDPRMSTTNDQVVLNSPTNGTPVVRTKYSPYSGATFKENPTYDGKIIGRRVGDENIGTPVQLENGPLKAFNIVTTTNGGQNANVTTQATTQAPPRPKERRRQPMKGTLPPGQQPTSSSHDITPPQSPTALNADSELFNIVGKGVFEVGKQEDDRGNGGTTKTNGRRGSKGSEAPGSNPPSGIVGIGLEKTSSLSEDDDPNTQENFSKPALSKTFQESLAQKKRLQQMEVEQRQSMSTDIRFDLGDDYSPIDNERLSRTNVPTGLDMAQFNSNRNNATSKPPVGNSVPKRPKPRNSDAGLKSPMSDRSLSTGFGDTVNVSTDDPVTAGPFNNGDKVFPEALHLIAANDWQSKCQGLGLVRRLAYHHKEVLLRDLHPCVLAVTQEMKNLRSQVTRLAIQSLGDLYLCLGRAMDADLDLTVRVLLHKSGDSSTFIRDDVEVALGRMVDSVTPQRAVTALIQGGSNDRNMQVRRFCARNLCLICERMGPGRVLSGVKEVTDRILPVAAQFTMDSSPETRWFGRRIFHGLLQHQDFNRMCQRFIPSNVWRNMHDIIGNLRTKGLGECPSSTPSAGMRRSESLTRGSSAGSLTSLDGSSPSGSSRSTTSAPHSHHQSHTSPQLMSSTHGPSPGRRNEIAAEEAKRLIAQLNSTNWSIRHAAVNELVQWCETDGGRALRQQTTRILDAFVLRLSDSNSKVNLFALQSLERMLPVLRELHLGPVISVMVQHTASNLASKNQEIARTASRLLDAFIEQLDSTILVQPYVQAVTAANSRIKPEMIQKLTILSDRLCPRKPRLVTLHVLPELWRLLISLTGTGAGGASVISGSRGAVQSLVAVLYEHMRDSLMEMARTYVNATPRMLQLLSDMIDNVGRGS